MKNVFRLLIITALAVTFALPALAQDTAGGAAAASAQDEEAKGKLYEKFLGLIKQKDPASQKAAFDTGKEYLSKYGTPEDDIVKYVRNWVGKYEVALLNFEFESAVDKKDLPKAYQLGQQMLASSPDNVHVHLRLTGAGYLHAVETKNKANAGQIIGSARKALELIEQGKAPEKWMTFGNRDEAIGGLNYMLGYFTLDNSQDEAAKYLIKAAQSSSKFSKEPTTYLYLGAAYYNGEFKRLSSEYKAKYEGKEETPESVALFERINQTLDRVIDAYARAAALSTDATQKKSIMDQLTAVYKIRHDNSDAGLQQYVASVLSRPLPLPGQPVTPATTPASTGAATPSSTATPATNGNAATTTPAGAAAKPAATNATNTNGTTAKPANTNGTTAKPANTPANPKP